MIINAIALPIEYAHHFWSFSMVLFDSFRNIPTAHPHRVTSNAGISAVKSKEKNPMANKIPKNKDINMLYTLSLFLKKLIILSIINFLFKK